MTNKELLTDINRVLAHDRRVRFIGYNTRYGHRMYGTLNEVPKRKCIETPVAESLMVGLAMGMSLEGFRPIIMFERMDFMLVAADQIINHLALLPKISGNQFQFPVLIRAIIGSQDKKFDLGLQHTKDLTYIFKPYIETKEFTGEEYYNYKWDKPLIITERKDDYERDCITRRI